MNKIEILLKKYREGGVQNQDLALCLHYINQMQLEKVRNETRVSHTEGTDTVSREDNNTSSKRSKAKRL